MHQVRSDREAMPSTRITRTAAPVAVRTDLSSLLNGYTNTHRQHQDRLESLEREMALLKGQVSQAFNGSEDIELNRTYTTKKALGSARATSPSRIPLPITTPRKQTTDNSSLMSGKTGASNRTAPVMPITRSRTFHNASSSSSSSTNASPPDENGVLRSYRAHLEQVLHKESTLGIDIKVPTYLSIEDVLKANEQLLLENERLRSELNRLKTESILLLRTMKTNTTGDGNSGNERITAERERQELTIELARQVEENKRLRRSLLVQSEKFLSLRQSIQVSDGPKMVNNDHRQTPDSSSQMSQKSGRVHQSKSARHHSDNRGYVRPKSFYQGPNDPL